MFLSFALTLFLIFVTKFNFSNSQFSDVVPSCSSTTCRFGECEQLEFDFRCHCGDGIKGILCDRLLKETDTICLSSPCWNGGVCRQIGNDYTCDCMVGSSGKNCRTLDKKPCPDPSPCQNGATCKSTIGSEEGFECKCTSDWIGTVCDIPLPLCMRKNPCFNGGVCTNNVCQCSGNFTGEFCQRLISESLVATKADKKVIIKNKGGYIAHLMLDYTITSGVTKLPTRQTGSISLGQDYAFYIPGSIDFNIEPGAVLTIDAVGGIRVLQEKIKADPECFHVWGTTLIPLWSTINC